MYATVVRRFRGSVLKAAEGLLRGVLREQAGLWLEGGAHTGRNEFRFQFRSSWKIRQDFPKSLVTCMPPAATHVET